MTSRSTVPGLLTFVCAVIAMVSCKDASVDLRFVPEENARYELSYEGSGTGVRNGITEKHSISYLWELHTKNDSGVTSINATYKRFKADLLTPQDSLRMDSDHPIADSLAQNNPKLMMPWVWQAVKGLSFDFRMNNLGKIETVGSFTPLLTELTKKVLKDSALAQTDKFSAVWDIAASQFSAAASRDLLQQLFPEYPGRALKVGDTLTRTYKYNSGLPLMVVQQFKVTEITAEQVSLLMGGAGFLEEGKENSVKAEQQGKIIVNRKTGMMESAYLEEVINGTLDNQPFQQNATVQATCRKLN
jgi:hypothetical protein